MPSGGRRLVPDLALAGAVFLSRIPFLGPGAGTDTDGWYLVGAAREMVATGRYTRSRFPGYPVQEWLCSLIARAGGGAVAMNVLSALAATACAVAFARVLGRLGVRDAWLSALALVSIPAAYVASVSCMDYLFAVAFLLAACDAMLRGRAVVAGLWLGLAIGSRLTSLVLLPAVVLLPRVEGGPSPRFARRTLALLLPSALIGVACYVPAYARYGWGFLKFTDPLRTGSTPLDFLTGFAHIGQMPIPPALILGQATVLLWGVPGTVLLVAACVRALMTRRAVQLHAAVPARVQLAAALAIALELLLYLRLPHDEGYLLPAVPFTLLIAAARLPRGWFRAVCAAAIVSPFILGVDVDPPKKGVPPLTRSALAITWPVGAHPIVLEPLRGPLLLDHAKRVRARAIVDRVIAARATLPPGAFLLAGVLNAELEIRLPLGHSERWYTDYVSEPDLKSMLARGRDVLLLPAARERVIQVAGFDPVAAGARAMFADDP
ncbi:MAG TPA: hypothetical protein VN896_14390 [Methylomirabilota bacterium]|nr:hypothetical protein [Methylomirabilota bacterium]